MRITHFPAGKPVPEERPWLKDVLLPKHDLIQGGNPIRVESRGGLISAKNAQDQVFFREIKTPRLEIRKIRPYFYLDIPQVAFHAGLRKVNEGIQLEIERARDESFYGGGEWFNGFERTSGTIWLDNRNALFGEQNHLTYSGLPFFLSSRGYGLLLLNSFRSKWSFKTGKLIIESDGPGADYILIYGPKYKDILETYTSLTGRPPLLPRWAFGLWLTSYPQTDQAELLTYLKKHRELKIPLDAVILDYHWEERFHNLKWRKSLFPDPQNMIRELKELGIHLGLILTPFLNTKNRPLQKWLLNRFGQNVSAQVYRDDERDLEDFILAKSEGYLAHENVKWWFGSGGMLDFTNPKAASWWQTRLGELFKQGVDFIKNDDGEDLPDDGHSFNGMDGREYHNLYGFYYGKATFEAADDETQNKPRGDTHPRHVIYARNTWLGSQRYPALFLGDQEANFEGIRRSIRGGLNLGMAGFSYWTADTFGLSGKNTPEIHMRYAQWALLSPVARYFSRPEEIDNTRFPWSHQDKVLANFRKYANLRMELLPYTNTLAHESYQKGIPILRPMILEFQDEVRFRSVDDQVMLGSQLMICPVLEHGVATRKIILPAGTWCDFWSAQTWQGGTTIEYPAPLDRLPLLVKGGSILAMSPVLQHIPENHRFDPLILRIWKSFPAHGSFVDDDGVSMDYQNGGFAVFQMDANQTDDVLRIAIGKAQGQFNGQSLKRKVIVILPDAGMIETFRINGFENDPSLVNQNHEIQFDQDIQKETLIEVKYSNMRGNFENEN